MLTLVERSLSSSPQLHRVLGLRFAVSSDAGPKLEAGVLASPSLGLGDVLLVALALTILTEPPCVDVLAFGQVRVSDHADIRAVAHEPASMAGREGVEACSRQFGIAGAGLPVWKKMVAQEVVHLPALMRHLDLFFERGCASSFRIE